MIEFWKFFVFIFFLDFFLFEFLFGFLEISYFLIFDFSEILFFWILFIAWYYLTLTLTRPWHYLTLTVTRSWYYLTLTLSDTDIDWVLKFLSSSNFLISFFIKTSFFLDYIFFICFWIWKKIKETGKNLNKRIYCSLSKQWLIDQQLLIYCIGTTKIDKKFDFKVKSSDLDKRLFNSGSRRFTQKYIIIWIVCIFLIVKTVSLIK